MIGRYGAEIIDEIISMSANKHDCVEDFINKTRKECRELAADKDFNVNIP